VADHSTFTELGRVRCRPPNKRLQLSGSPGTISGGAGRRAAGSPATEAHNVRRPRRTSLLFRESKALVGPINSRGACAARE
jgi:hypothetical protein